ncbi:REP-associated tyrosine transposase [Metabacillus malikii]|uniref:REP element-mobilizing transposase RayT n=1 Tax=Metabacillus malikii TaxID=1504265 RepID=A0ABT9ZLI2_9BACI|nr:transposase [Metabacillus malikii]MDQ0233157.1 REP element-mobilizing transposase RayT [Metabacillus malikii]
MPRRARTKSVSGIYHVMLRGVNRQEIFHDDEDCYRFLDLLKMYKEKLDYKLYAWCLMNNHVHLLIEEGNESISNTMKRIGVCFVYYYHEKYKTVGHLFQDRFRSENVDTSRYFLTVVRYIHQNPVKAGITEKPVDWRWSSCLGYYGRRVYPAKLLDKQKLFNLFSHDNVVAMQLFKEFNEKENDDECLEDHIRLRLTDEEAREFIKTILSPIEIAQFKTLPKNQRNEFLQQIKQLQGISQRQSARILGISPNLIFKA